MDTKFTKETMKETKKRAEKKRTKLGEWTQTNYFQNPWTTTGNSPYVFIRHILSGICIVDTRLCLDFVLWLPRVVVRGVYIRCYLLHIFSSSTRFLKRKRSSGVASHFERIPFLLQRNCPRGDLHTDLAIWISASGGGKDVGCSSKWLRCCEANFCNED